jgi:polyphosphate kinase
MFNYLTGYGRPTHYRKVLIAPNQLRDGLLDQIERTIAAQDEGRSARIVMKMNALVDGPCIRALYRASQAGVKVDLNVRGICCLRPGVEGVSENIRVVSIVGRLLEHSRVYAFERGGEHTVYISSADLMPRNLDHRVELAAPVTARELQAELLDTLDRAFADNQNSWELDAEGIWTRRTPEPGEPPRSLQLELAEHYAGREPAFSAAESTPAREPEPVEVAVGQARGSEPAPSRPTPVALPWALRQESL